MGGRGFYFLDKQRSGRKCLVSGSDRRIFCSTEMFNKEMLCEFVLSIGGVGGGGSEADVWGGGYPCPCCKLPESLRREASSLQDPWVRGDPRARLRIPAPPRSSVVSPDGFLL